MRDRPASPRGTLDAARIISAAVAFIDEHGLHRLTMQRLGAHLGVEAMALYRYVPGREALLDGVVDAVVDELFRDPEVHLRAHAGWADYLRRLAHGVRRTALAHPEIFPLIATRPPAAPWVRPPLRSLRWIESLLEVMTGAGLSGADAAVVYRGFSGFLLGHLLLEVSVRGDRRAGPPAADLAGYPLLRRLRPQLSAGLGVRDFEEALQAQLDRIARMLPPQGPGSRG